MSLVEKAAETIDAEEADKLAKKMAKGQFDLDDLAGQLQQMKRMGGLQGIMGMLPGVAKMKGQMAESGIDDRMILRQVLPNVLSPIMVAATLGIATAIITESALSFLGLGFPPDFPTWGRLLYDAIEQMQMYPWRVILPGVFISLTVLTVNYIGDGLRDAMDPRIRGR